MEVFGNLCPQLFRLLLIRFHANYPQILVHIKNPYSFARLRPVSVSGIDADGV